MPTAEERQWEELDREDRKKEYERKRKVGQWCSRLRTSSDIFAGVSLLTWIYVEFSDRVIDPVT